MQIRTATSDDDAALLMIDDLTWSPTVSPVPRSERTTYFSDSRTPGNHLVAVEGEQRLGFVQMTPATPIPASAHTMELGLAVHPDAQGRGVGGALIDAALAEARRRGLAKVRVRVLATNPRAQALYERHGFAVEAVLRGEFRLDGCDVDDVWLAQFL